MLSFTLATNDLSASPPRNQRGYLRSQENVTTFPPDPPKDTELLYTMRLHLKKHFHKSYSQTVTILHLHRQ